MFVNDWDSLSRRRDNNCKKNKKNFVAVDSYVHPHGIFHYCVLLAYFYLVRFVNFVSLDCDVAGIEYIDAGSDDSPWGGATIQDSLIVGHSQLTTMGSFQVQTSDQQICTKHGIWTGFSARLVIKNVTFVNFDNENCTTFGTCAHCKTNDGTAITHTSDLTFINSPNRIQFPFSHSALYQDLDGTLTGHVNGTILPTSGYLDPSKCQPYPAGDFGSVNASLCQDMRFARMYFNKILPDSINEKDAIVETQYGQDRVAYRKKTTFKPSFNGYATFLPLGGEVKFFFDNSTHLNNLTYHMMIQELFDEDHVLVNTQHTQIPDHFSTIDEVQQNDTGETPIASSFEHGDWHFDDTTKVMTYLISGKGNNQTHPQQKTITYNVYNCYFEGCEIPTPPPVPSGRPENAKKWSEPNDWAETDYPFGGYGSVVPSANDDVVIRADWWMVMDMPGVVTLNRLYVYGALEFEPTKNHHLKANVIIVSGLNGILIAGFPDAPFPNNIIISLMGDHDSEEMPITSDLTLGAKAIGIFGRASLIGAQRDVHWTKLKTTIMAGGTQIQVIFIVLFWFFGLKD